MGHSVHPRPRQDEVGCEQTAVRQVARARRPPVQPYCSDDTGYHVGAGFGRKPSIVCGISADRRRGIVTSASWNVTDRVSLTTLAAIVTSLSRGVVSDQCSWPPAAATQPSETPEFACGSGPCHRHDRSPGGRRRSEPIPSYVLIVRRGSATTPILVSEPYLPTACLKSKPTQTLRKTVASHHCL